MNTKLKSVPADLLHRAVVLLRTHADTLETGRADLETLEAILANRAVPRRLAVVLEGGIVQSVVGQNVPDDIDLAIVDYDTDGADAEDLTPVRQANGSEASAIVSSPRIDDPVIDLDSVFADEKDADDLGDQPV